MAKITVPGAERQASQSHIIDIFSTGGFIVPGSPSPLTMHLYFSSSAFEDAAIGFQVNRLPDGDKVTVLSGSVNVPGRGVAVVQVDLAELNLAGKKIEVVFDGPLLEEFQIHPSASIVTQEGVPVLFLSTGDFETAREIQVDGSTGVRSVPAFLNLVTWGMFDVPDTTAETEPVAEVRLSSLSDEPEVAIVNVFLHMEGTTQKMMVARVLVIVPAGGADIVQIFGAAGLALEVVIELPFAQPPNPVMELLTASLEIVMQNSETGDLVESVLYLAPGQLRFL